MNILLIHPPDELTRILGRGKAFIQKYEPLGLLSIAACAREKGYPVQVIDAYAEGIGFKELKTRIASMRPDIVGISTLTCQGRPVYYLGRWLKRNLPGTLVVLGNIHASVYARQYLGQGCCDIVVHGEGEQVFLEILKSHEKKTDISSIPGISFLHGNGEVVTTSGDNTIEDLSLLPFPARDLVKQELYNLTEISNQTYVGRKKGVSKTLMTSRGCPYRCTFCAVHRHGRPRYRDAVKVVDEMELLVKQYNTSYIFIADSLFMSDTERLNKICSEIRRRKLRVQWGCPTHVNYITPEIIKTMAAAGCRDLSLGIESGSQRILDGVRKGISLDRVKQAVDIIRRNSKIKTEGLFILGLPGETLSEAYRTLRLAKSLPLDMAQFNIFTPYPGSQLFDDLAKKGELDTGIRGAAVDPSVWHRFTSYICFTSIQPIWVTPAFTANRLRHLQKRALREFYLRPGQIIRHAGRVRLGNTWKIFGIIMDAFVKRQENFS